MEEEEAADESDDSNRASIIAHFSFGGADKVKLQKPIIKPQVHAANGGRRRVTTIVTYAREASANAKFGARLVHTTSHQASRPASRRAAYAPGSSANAKFGARLISAHPPGQASRPAARRTGYGRKSSTNPKFSTRLVQSPSHLATHPANHGRMPIGSTPLNGGVTLPPDETHSTDIRTTWEHPSWDRSIPNNITTDNISQTSVSIGDGKTAPNENKGLASPALSDDSGVGLYREIMN